MAFAIATFNVKDLLEPSDPGDRAVLPAKLDAIAASLRACDADVVGLQEVGEPSLVDDLRSRLDGCGYGAPVLGTRDARGIRCALVSRAPVMASQVHTAAALTFPAFFVGDPEPFGTRIPLRRGVVHARIDAPNLGPVDVFVAHFKSSRPVPLRTGPNAQGLEEIAVDTRGTSARDRAEGMLRSAVWRAAEALFVRALVDAAVARDPGAHVAVTGDLNDVPDSIVLKTLRADGPAELFDCTLGIEPTARFSTIHGSARVQIDHMLATSNLHARLETARFLNAGLREHPPAEGGREERLTIDSDHAPLVVRFR